MSGSVNPGRRTLPMTLGVWVIHAQTKSATMGKSRDGQTPPKPDEREVLRPRFCGRQAEMNLEIPAQEQVVAFRSRNSGEWMQLCHRPLCSPIVTLKVFLVSSGLVVLTLAMAIVMSSSLQKIDRTASRPQATMIAEIQFRDALGQAVVADGIPQGKFPPSLKTIRAPRKNIAPHLPREWCL